MPAVICMWYVRQGFFVRTCNICREERAPKILSWKYPYQKKDGSFDSYVLLRMFLPRGSPGQGGHPAQLILGERRPLILRWDSVPGHRCTPRPACSERCELLTPCSELGIWNCLENTHIKKRTVCSGVTLRRANCTGRTVFERWRPRPACSRRKKASRFKACILPLRDTQKKGRSN